MRRFGIGRLEDLCEIPRDYRKESVEVSWRKSEKVGSIEHVDKGCNLRVSDEKEAMLCLL
jgi:hypothetical protein